MNYQDLFDPERLRKFLESEGLLGEKKFEAPTAMTEYGLFQKEPPPPLDFESQIKKWLRTEGYEILGELRKPEIKPPFDPMADWKPLPVTHPEAPTVGTYAPLPQIPEELRVEERPEEILKRPVDYVPPAGFWQQIKDVATGVMTGKIDPFGLIARNLIRGITFGNVDVAELIEKISGKKGFAEDVHKAEEELYKEEVGYVPEKALKTVEIPSQIIGSILPLSKVLKGTTVAAKAMTKIPIMQSLARAEMTGLITGLLRKPEDEGLLNRIKQIPSDIAFFTALDLGFLTAEQAVKMIKWHRTYGKTKGIWGEFKEIPPIEPGIPAREVKVDISAEEVRNLFRKMQGNLTSDPSAWEPLTDLEKKIINVFTDTGTWKEAVRRGWIGEFVIPEVAPKYAPSGIFARVAGEIPRQPRFADIFRRGPLPAFEPIETREVHFPGARPEAAPAAAPRAEAPPSPVAGFRRAGKGIPAVVVDVKPNAAGGWTYNFKIPTAEEVPIPERISTVRPPRLGPGEAKKLLPESITEKIDERAEAILDDIIKRKKEIPIIKKPKAEPRLEMKPLIRMLSKKPIELQSIENLGLKGEFLEILELQRAKKIPRIIVGAKARGPKQILDHAIESAKQEGMIKTEELEDFLEALRGEVRGIPAPPARLADFYAEKQIERMMDDYYEHLASQHEDDLAELKDVEGTPREEEIKSEILTQAEKEITQGMEDIEKDIVIEEEFPLDSFFKQFPEYGDWISAINKFESLLKGHERDLKTLEDLSWMAHDAGIPTGMLPKELGEEYLEGLEAEAGKIRAEEIEREVARIKPEEPKFELRREAEKEKWQMTRQEYEAVKTIEELPHKKMITKALREGKKVPDEALIEYPDLRRMRQVRLIEPMEIPRAPTKVITKTKIPSSFMPKFGEVEPRQLALDEEVSGRLFEEIKPEERKFSDSDLLKIFAKYNIPPEFQSDVALSLERFYETKKGPVENYVRKILGRLSGKLKAEEAKARAEEVPLGEVPSREKGPFEIFAEKEEESRVNDLLRKAAKDDREFEILKSRIIDEETYENIGKKYDISAQAIEKAVKKSLQKLKNNPDVISMLKRKMEYMRLGPAPTEQDLKEFAISINRWFTSRRGMAEHIDAMNDQRIGSRLAEQFEASLEAKDLRKFIENNKTPGMEKFTFDSLRGELNFEETALPEDAKNLIRKMRQRIDKLSQLIIAHGGLSEKTEEVFTRNLGKYVARKFRLYEQKPREFFGLAYKRWNPPPEARNEFKAFLKSEYPKTFGQFTEEELEKYLDAMLHKRDYFFKPRGKTTKRIPTDIFKHRKDLPEAYRKFAGEIEDPVWVYLYTVTKQAQAAYNAQLFNAFAEEYPDLWTKSEAAANRKGWQNTRLPKDYGYGMLKGAFIEPSLFDFLKNEYFHEVGATDRALLKWIVNPFKATKTLGSIPTHARNTLGNVMFSILMRNSILNPVNHPHYFEALKIILNRNTTARKEWADLIKRGVTETQFYGAEIPKFYKNLLRLDPPDWPEKIFDFALRKPADFAGKLYNFEDVIYRVAADIKNIKHFKMTPEDSVKEINRSMTNYRKLPYVVDWLRRWTVFGPFISFKANVAKIVTSQLTQGIKELTGKARPPGAPPPPPPTPPEGFIRPEAGEMPPPKETKWTKAKMRAHGLRRLLTLGFVVGLPSLISKIAMEIGNFDEDEIKKLEMAYPAYRRHGQFVYFRWKGKIKVFDLSYIWPTGDFERAIRAAIAGDAESFTEALQFFAHPIFDVYQVVIRGREPYWDQPIPGTGNIWKDVWNRAAIIAKNIWIPASMPVPDISAITKGEIRPGALTPYQIKSIIDAYNQEPDRYGRVKDLSEELKNFFTGLRTWNVDPQKLLLQTIRAERAKMTERQQQYYSWLKSHPGAPAWEKIDKKKEAEKVINKLAERLKTFQKLYNELSMEGWGFKK